MPALQSNLATAFISQLNCSFLSDVQAGSLLVAGVCSRDDPLDVFDDLNPGSYTKAIDHQDTFGPGTFSDIWYLDPTDNAGGPCTITNDNGVAVSQSMGIAEVPDIAAAPLDKTAVGTNFNTTANTGSTATTTQADEYLFAVIGNEGAGRTITWAAGWTELEDGGSQTSVSIAEREVSATGAYSVGNSTISGADSLWVACLATFKVSLGPPATLVQEGYRFRNDDGSETTATWKGTQDTSVNLAPGDTARVRVLIDGTVDPDAAQFQLEYRKVGDSTWIKVE